MKIVIIGSKGFIGSHCTAHYLSKGYEVIGCDIYEVNEPNYKSFESLNNDFSSLFIDNDIDYCINAAGSANVSYSYEFPEKDFELNVSLVINILGAIKTFCPKCKFINFSSAAVYGNPTSLPIKEESELKPLSPYGYHKLLSEKLLNEYHYFFSLRTCSLRVFSAYGPGLKKQLFWDIYKKTLTNNKVNLFGNGDESRDFIYISDLVHAVDCVIEKADFKGETINIASGIETRVDRAAQLLLKYYNKDATLTFNGNQKSGDPKNWRADISVLKSFGFKVTVPIEKGVEHYALWLKKDVL